MLLSLGTMRVVPPSGWLLAVVSAATARLHAFGPQELSNALLGMSRMWPLVPGGAGGGGGGQAVVAPPAEHMALLQRWVEAAEAHFPCGPPDGSAAMEPPSADASNAMDATDAADATGALDATDTAAAAERSARRGGGGGAGPSGRRGPGDTLNTQELCNVLYAVARLRLAPGASWTDRALAALAADMRGLRGVPRQAAMAAWALQVCVHVCVSASWKH